MANWVFNYLTVKSEFLDKIVNKEGNVDFNIIAPMPAAVGNILENGSIDMDIYYYLSERLKKPLKSMIRNKLLLDSCKISDQSTVYPWEGKVPPGMTVTEFKVRQLYKRTLKSHQTTHRPSYNRGRDLVCNYRRYGVRSWYDWRLNKWGCKWNASSSYVPDKEDEKGGITIEFDTPWSCPYGWLDKLGELRIPFYLEWIEEMGYHGEAHSDGTTVKYTDLPSLTWDEEKEEYVEYKEDIA